MTNSFTLKAPSTNLARALAQFAYDLRYEDLPDGVKDRSRHHILDAIGIAFASHHFPFAARGLAGISAAGAPGASTVIGGGANLQPRDAALCNGYLMHGLDFDDTHPDSIVHATVTCLPAALAVGEMTNGTWGQLLAAYAAGMETAIRIGRAVKGGFHHAGFHATGVVSHFSSAVVAGKMLGLSVEQIISAQGINSSTAAGLQVFLETGAWTKRMHPGWGALAGITAAQMAKAGFKGPERPYEGKFGLFETHLQERADQVDTESVLTGLKREWTLLDTSIKPYPICHFIHACAEAALVLRSQVSDISHVQRIVCELPEVTLPIVAEPASLKQEPRSDYEAKFSVQFVVAACLLRGRFTLIELEESSLADPQILELAAKIQCVAQIKTQFPKYFSGAVTIHKTDGTSVHHDVPVNLGCDQRVLSLNDIISKFHTNAALVLSEVRIQTVLDSLLNAQSDTPVREITRLLA